MSTASLVPETWELDGDDARRTLVETGRRRLLADAFVRLRVADGFSHARSLAFMTSLVLVQGLIALVGFASLFGQERFSHVIVRTIQGAAPGPAGRLLTRAVIQAQHNGSSHRAAGLVFGLVGALVAATTEMGQLERALNRLYGVEQDRPSVQKYGFAFLLAVSAGTLIACAFATLAFGRTLGDALRNDSVSSIWNAVRWPLGLLLAAAAVTMLFRWCPRRHQPSASWLVYGSVVSVVLWSAVTAGLAAFFSLSSSFGQTYGPLAGMVGLLLWALLSAVAILYGAAVAAQLEAVRAGRAAPQDEVKVAESEPEASPESDELEPRSSPGDGLAATVSGPTLGPGDAERSPDPARRLRRTLEGVIGVAATEGNRIEVLRNGDRIFAAMLEAIGAARHTVDFLTFVYWDGEIGTRFAEVLTARATSGRARPGAPRRLGRPPDGPLAHRRHGGCRRRGAVVPAHQSAQAREASTTAPTGRSWSSTKRSRSPAVSASRTSGWVMPETSTSGATPTSGSTDQPSTGSEPRSSPTGPRRTWTSSTNASTGSRSRRSPDVPSSSACGARPGPGQSDVAILFRTLLQLATSRLRITTAYFVPDDDLTERLCAAADRGVEVEVLVPGPHADKRFVQLAAEATYADLLDHGIRIASFQPSMLHAKLITVDGMVATIGSANFNARSVSLDDEINLVVIDEDVVRVLDEQFEDDLTRSVELDREPLGRPAVGAARGGARHRALPASLVGTERRPEMPAWVRSGADGVEAAVDVDDLAGGGGEPVGEQGDAGLGDRLAVADVPAERRPLGPDLLEPLEAGDALRRDGAERARRRRG